MCFQYIGCIGGQFGADRKICASGSLFGITLQSLVMPNSDPRTDRSIRTLHPWKILIVSPSSLYSLEFQSFEDSM